MTQIIEAKIDLNMQWDISPTVVLTVKGCPYNKMSNYAYEERGGMYRAETPEGFTHFFHWKGPGNDGGFGGRVFKVKMVDGTTRTIKGAWSSNAEFCSSVFSDRKPLVEVTIMEENNQYSSISGSMLTEKCCELLELPKMNYQDFNVYLLILFGTAFPCVQYGLRALKVTPPRMAIVLTNRPLFASTIWKPFNPVGGNKNA